MKKLFNVLLVVFVFTLTSCSAYVENFKETEKPYGKDITFSFHDSNFNSTYYTLIYPDFLYGNPTFIIEKHPNKDLNPNKKNTTETIKNSTVGEIVKENGEIKSIVINGKKYVAY